MVKSITRKDKKNSKIHKNKKEDKKMSKSKSSVVAPASKKTETTKNDSIKSKEISIIESHVESRQQKKGKSSTEINSLKQMEEKILEKFEEHKPELMEILNVEENPSIAQDMTNPASSNEKTNNEQQPEIEPEKIPETVEKDQSSRKDAHKADEKENKSSVEAVLFAVGKYLEDEAIAQLCNIDKKSVKKALEELRKEYDAKDGALMIVQEGNSWKINVREKYLSLVRKIVSDTELSKSIMETLAVIAWKTPIYQNEVVRIRGNKCYDHIAELENAGFVTKDKKGRSYVLKTTEKFYNYFDIDQKNLHGVMNEAKMPVEQKTLEEIEKPEEKTYSRENLIHALETIETKSIVQTEEDKLAQKEFLDKIHQKIGEASRRTDEAVADIPRPMHESTGSGDSSQTQQEDNQPAEGSEPAAQTGTAVTEKDEEIIINTDIPNGSEHHFQKPEEQPQKPKQLTRKQLEKKFKDELLRVRDKADKKK